MPSVRSVSQSGNWFEAVIHLGDLNRAASLGLTPVAEYPNGAGYARLRLNTKGLTAQKIAAAINAKVQRDWADFEAIVTPSGLVALRNRPVTIIEEPDIGIPMPTEPHESCYYFDGGEFTDFSPWRQVAFMEVQSTTKRSGNYAFKPTSAGGYARTPLYSSTGADIGTSSQVCSRVYHMFTSAPTANAWLCNINSEMYQVYVDYATGKLVLVAGAYSDMGDTVHGVGVWRRIEMHARQGSDASHTTVDVYMDGVLECSLVDLAIAPSFSEFDIGKTTVSLYSVWDDVYLGSALIGEGQCSTPCMPTGVGDDNAWTSSSGGDKWLDVDDLPSNDDTDYVYASASLKQTFTHDGAAQGRYAGATKINAIGYWARMCCPDEALYRRMIESGATEKNSAYLAEVAYEWGKPLFWDADFDTTKPGAWTEAAVDALEIGGNSYLVAYNRRMTTCALFVDWVPPAAAGDIARISGIDWANVKKVSGVAEASVSKISGVAAN